MQIAHLDGLETMVSMPSLTSHPALSEDELRKAKLSPYMVRISVGLENTEDLITDFEQALHRV